jgi:hypothetical protein
MTAITKTTHKTKPITIVDLSNLKAAEANKKLGEAQKEIAALPPKSTLLITDVSNTEITNEFINVVIDFAKKNSPYVKACRWRQQTRRGNLVQRCK